MNLMSAMGGISDKHVAEFAYVSPRKGHVKLWMKIASAAACLAVAVAAVPKIREVISVSFDSSGRTSSVNYDLSDPVYSNMSRVIYEGKMYLLSFDHLPIQLPEGCEVVGEITTVDPNDSVKDGFSDYCNVGELIYRDPELPNEIYVYTSSGGEGAPWQYLRFAERETFEIEQFFTLRYVIYINGRWYGRLSSGKPLSELPDGYVLIDTVEDLDRYNTKHFDSTDNWLHIGDMIYQNPDFPGDVYIYSALWEQKEFKLYRFTDLETIRREGNIRNLFC